MDRVIPLIGSVFVAQNLAQKILAQYYFKFNRPAKTLQVVSPFDEGIETIYRTYQLNPIEEN